MYDTYIYPYTIKYIDHTISLGKNILHLRSFNMVHLKMSHMLRVCCSLDVNLDPPGGPEILEQ